MPMQTKYIAFIVFMCYLVSNAQQEPQYSQYMYNMSTVNPGYVTDQSSMISLGLLYRAQWTGLAGAPRTPNVFVNLPISEKIEFSVNYVNDRIGDAIPLNNHYANVDAAYILQLSEQFKLSFGLKVGANNFRIDASASDVASDPAFKDKISSTNLTLGAGVYLFKHNFYLGFSAPNLLPADASIGDLGVSQSKTHLYAISGFVFDLLDEVKLKPSLVVKQVIDAPFTFDVSLNSLMYERFELGVSYRYTDAFVALAGFHITKSLKIGYAYDFSLGDLGGYNNGSHEFILRYDFDLLNFSKTYTSPRFF